MKKIKFLWTLMALPLLAACSSDDLVKTDSGKTNIPEGEGFYMTVNFAPFNKGTRSYTNGDNSSNGGVEVGSADENKVNKALIVLATEKNEYIASGVAEGSQLAGTSDKTNYQASAKIEKTKIKDYYDLPSVKSWIKEQQDAGNTGNPRINVFIYCNPTEKLVDDFAGLDLGETKWTDWKYTLEDLGNYDDTLWSSSKGFLMTNESLATREFPSAFETWNSFTTVNNPFDLSGWNNRNQSTAVDNLTGRGTINVHRMAARFDFRDGSQGIGGADPVGNGIKGEPFTYAMMVGKITTGEGETEVTTEEVLVKATIETMSLVNVLKEQYFLERVSTGTTNDDWTTPYKADDNPKGYKLLGEEKPWYSYDDENNKLNDDLNGNWVVTPQADKRTGASLKANKSFASYYKYPFFNPEGVVASRGAGWDIWKVEDVVKGKNDYDNTGNYHIWRYLTENTMLGGNDDQMNGNTTGIVFRARLRPGDYLLTSDNYWDNELYKTLSNRNTNGPVLYAFSNNLYCSWAQIQYAALKSAGYDNTKGDNQELDKTGTFYKAVFGDGAPGRVTIYLESGDTKIYEETVTNEAGEEELAPQDPNSPNFLHEDVAHDPATGGVTTTGEAWEKFRDAVVANTFTIYEKYNVGSDAAPDWGYFCYYYYWNRHNDNGDNDVMGEMEFAVVRNNVYKLAVTNLKKLGHPRIPENDPDDPEPDTPDEKADLYLTVSVQVLPWVVRVNDIEFY